MIPGDLKIGFLMFHSKSNFIAHMDIGLSDKVVVFMSRLCYNVMTLFQVMMLSILLSDYVDVDPIVRIPV